MTVQELLKAAQTLIATEQPQLADKLKVLAKQNHHNNDQSSLEAEPTPIEEDPIVCLFLGSPDLSMRAKEILAEEIKPGSSSIRKLI